MSATFPTRLFKLNIALVRGVDETFDFAQTPLGHIVQGSELLALKSCNYCAVSHVWGTKPPLFPIAGVPWAVPVSSIEKFIFILKTCERRGYDYLWFDLLCVNQKDRADQSAEMPKMRQYYKNAHATIVFGMNWKSFASQWTSVESRIEEWNGDRKKVIKADWGGFADIDTFISDDWFWRVWTLQEAVIPTTTTPLAAETTDMDPSPYTSARLLTSDGSPMDIPALCDLIYWTTTALGKLKYTDVPGKYTWIHPGAGIVNDHGKWWMMAVMNRALRSGPAKLHPIEAMLLTRYRDTRHPEDRLKGVYALIDQVWQKEGTDLDALLADLVVKYIEKKEGALLLTMAINNESRTTKTWAAGLFTDSKFGSAVPKGREYPLISAEIQGDTLNLTVAGLSNITVGPKSYGDGSGELWVLIDDLRQLQSSHDVSSIVSLINLAVDEVPFKSLDQISSFIAHSTSNGNSVSTALRGAFSGWDRCIITIAETVFLGWLPDRKSTSGKYSLLWLRPDLNEWAVIVEGDTKNGCKKVGIAYVNSVPVGNQPETAVKIL